MANGKLTAIFREIFEDDGIVLSPALDIRELQKWDSFNHVNLMIAVESEFDVVMTPQEVEETRSVGDLVAALEQKGCEVSL